LKAVGFKGEKLGKVEKDVAIEGVGLRGENFSSYRGGF